MSTYLAGILGALSESVLHAWANILDNYLSNKLFVRLSPLIFFSACVGLIFLPIIWIIDAPKATPLGMLGILLIVSVIEVCYMYPYYWALRHADTSVVTSLFSLGKIFLPILAFFIVGERLNSVQYAGFFILTLTSVFITLDPSKLRLNKAFFLMLGVSLLLTIQSILEKFAYTNGVGWGTSLAWLITFKFVIAGASFFFQKRDSREANATKSFMSVFPLLITVELLGWGGILGSSLALYLIPVSVARAISSTQPIFVLAFAVLFANVWPKLFKEYLDKKNIARKAVSFIFMIIGAILVMGV